MKLSKKINWKDLVVRAGKTFGQAFLSSICVESVFEVTSLNGIKGVLWSMVIAGLAAGISAVWNLLVAYVCDSEIILRAEEE